VGVVVRGPTFITGGTKFTTANVSILCPLVLMVNVGLIIVVSQAMISSFVMMLRTLF
jgi:hypothetical protein